MALYSCEFAHDTKSTRRYSFYSDTGCNLVREAWRILQKSVFDEKYDKLRTISIVDCEQEDFYDMLAFFSKVGYDFGDDILNVNDIMNQIVPIEEKLKGKYELIDLRREYTCYGCHDDDTPRAHTCILSHIAEGEIKNNTFPWPQ